VVDEEKYFLLEGFVYELNNTKYHSVRNNSNEHRIHLIIDVIPNEYANMVEFE
jgi:aspartyl/asparaginyl beta-hydroxylase (cupin superfamily)